MRASGLLALALLGCAAAHAQQDGAARTRCSADSDCVVAFSIPDCGPCGSCAGEPIALNARWLARREQTCAARRAADTRPRPRCSACPPPTRSEHDFAAVCRESICALHEVDAGTPPPPPTTTARSIDDLLAPAS